MTEQVKTVHKDLLAFEAKTEQRITRLDAKVDSLDRKMDFKIDSLAQALPSIVTAAVREANAERGKKRS